MRLEKALGWEAQVPDPIRSVTLIAPQRVLDSRQSSWLAEPFFMINGNNNMGVMVKRVWKAVIDFDTCARITLFRTETGMGCS